MLRAMCLDEVWYMVSPQNPLKSQATDLIDEDERLHLTDIALSHEEGLKASDFEFHLPRPSYTWNTLQELKRHYPDDTFVLIIGGDNWQVFNKWAHHEDILANHEIAIFPREDAEIDPSGLPDNVHVIDVPLVNVTSTMLRRMIHNDEDITPYVPECVAEEVRKRNLYR